ncbi:CHC2 zinc finger domain-containing protein [Vibrio parahaemolyticus]
MISKEQIEEIKSRASLSDFLSGELGGLQKAKRSIDSKKVTCCCPFHDDNNPSFEINDEKGYWHCWSGSCGNGDIFSAVQKIRGIDFHQALLYVADSIGYELKHDNTNVPKQATADVSIFSNALFSHFKLEGFNEKRNKINTPSNIDPLIMIGSFRCLDSKLDGWKAKVDSDIELKKSLTSLGYDLDFYGLLDESFILHPVWRLKQDNFASPSTVARTIPTANGPVDMEVVGFRVFNSDGGFEGVFPQGTMLQSSVSVPLVSFFESIAMNTDELVICDNYLNYLTKLGEGNFNSICIGAELNYSQVNSLFKLTNKSLTFECTQEFFQNHRNKPALISIGARTISEKKSGRIRLTDHDIEIDLMNYCLSVTQMDSISEDDFFPLADFYIKYAKAKGLGNSLPAIFKSITHLQALGHSPIDFIDKYLLKGSRDKESLASKYDSLVAMYGHNRKVGNVDRALKYFGISIEEMLGLDIKHAITTRLSKRNDSKMDMN